MTALDDVLTGNPTALITALGHDGRPRPIPPLVRLQGRQQFEGGSGLELVAAKDQLAAINAWERAQTEPMVCLDVHLGADEDRAVTIYFFDVRAEHGVHLLVVVTDDPAFVLDAARAHAAGTRPVAHIHKDAASVILEVDDATTALLGWKTDELLGHRTIEFVHPDDVQRAIDSWMEMRSGAGSGRVRLRYRHANGHYLWVEVTNQNRLDDDGAGWVLAEMVDISVEMGQLEALRDRERLLARLAEALPIGVCHLRPDGEVVYANEPLLGLLGQIDSIGALVQSFAVADRGTVELAVEHALQGRSQNLEVGVVHGFVERR